MSGGSKKVYDGSPIRFTHVTQAHLIWTLSTPGGGTAIEGRATVSSDQSPAAPKYYYRERYRALDQDGKRTIVTTRDRHEYDAEAQLFDLLADKVWREAGCDDNAYFGLAQVLRGEVTVYSGQGPCRSCRGIIRQFRREFPRVTVKVSYPKRGETPISLDKLGGSYGYDEAVEERGMWKITLPARVSD